MEKRVIELACIAALLSLPVPDRMPEIHHYPGRPPYLETAWGGDIFIDKNTVLYKDHLAHELAHWVMYQARIVHGIDTPWEENKAQFVQAKFQTWCE